MLNSPMKKICHLIKSRCGALYFVNNGGVTVPISVYCKRILVVSYSILLSFTITSNTRCNAMESNDFLTVSYPYVASDREINEVMAEFAQRTLLPINVSDALQGVIDIRNSGGTIGSFLNQVSAKIQAVWWYDGVVLHLEPSTSISSAYVDVEGMPADELEGRIGEVGLGWDSFPIRFSQDGSIARIAGPESYVSQVKEVVERLVEMQRNRPERVRRSIQPRLYVGGRGFSGPPREGDEVRQEQ